MRYRAARGEGAGAAGGDLHGGARPVNSGRQRWGGRRGGIDRRGGRHRASFPESVRALFPGSDVLRRLRAPAPAAAGGTAQPWAGAAGTAEHGCSAGLPRPAGAASPAGTGPRWCGWGARGREGTWCSGLASADAIPGCVPSLKQGSAISVLPGCALY